MKRYPDKIISLRFDDVACYICKSREVRHKIAFKYDSYVRDYEIADTWCFCPVCGEKYSQHFHLKNVETWYKSHLN